MSSLKHFITGAVAIALGLGLMAQSVRGLDAASAKVRTFLVTARAAAFVYAQEQTAEDVEEGATQAFLERLPDAVPGVESALVLRKTKIKAHSDPAKEGSRLDRDSLSDKDLFDAGNEMKSDVRKNVEEREKSAALTYEPYPEAQLSLEGGQLRVRVPSKVDGDFEALVQVEGAPQHPGAGFPISLLAIIIAAVVVFAGLGFLLRGSALLAAGNITLLATVLVGGLALLPNWRSGAREAAVAREAALVQKLLDAGAAASVESREALLRELNLDPRGREATTLDRVDADGTVVVSADYLQTQTSRDRRFMLTWAVPIGLLGMLLFTLGFQGLTQRAWASLKRNARAYAYLSPAMVGLGILVFIPVIYGISLGFQNRVYNEFEFVGLRNYINILSDADVSAPMNFYFTLGVTVMWTVVNVMLHVSIGLFLALLLNDQMLKARGVFRVLLIVPWAMPNYITALIWKQMFHNEFGAVNFFLAAVGVEPVSWFNTFWPAFSTNVATNTWLGFPFMMVVSLGALQSIPQDLYEAAYVDGASRWQRFRNVTLPLLMPAIIPAIIVGSVWTFNMFNIIYLVSGGAPNGATDILITEAFRWAFERDSYGYAAAYSTIIFVILLGFTVSTNKITGATKGAFE